MSPREEQDRAPRKGDPSREAGPGLVGEALGGYRLERELGHGAQGWVYLAHDIRLNRKVALKILPRRHAHSRRALLRFEREAEATARLDHPGICTVFEHGVEDGIHYIAMQYVEGENLAGIIATTRANSEEAVSMISFDSVDGHVTGEEEWHDADEAEEVEDPGSSLQRDVLMRVVRVVERAARALHVAHETGLVHRDIKPGNIMVKRDGEPVILDFGLALDEESDGPTLTASGENMGTPAYMSPEQVAGQRIGIDRRTDVYSLAVTLYECLTLSRPFNGTTREALYRQILTSELPDARRINRRIPRELHLVLQMATEKDPDRRYGTAEELADDLERVLKFEPVRAHPIPAWLRAVRWAQRNPIVAASLALVIVALATGLGVTLSKNAEIHGKNEEIRAKKEEVDRQNRLATAALADVTLLSDQRDLVRVLGEVDGLWPRRPERLPAMRAWLAEGAELLEKKEVYLAALKRARDPEATILGTRHRAWAEMLLIEILSALSRLEKLYPEVEGRRRFAEELEERTVTRHRDLWRRTIEDILTRPAYKGLSIEPQLGLIPLGVDKGSGLHEFLHFASHEGPIPHRNDDGLLHFTERTGVVLVLIPGGTFQRGYQSGDPDAPNYDYDSDKQGTKRILRRHGPPQAVTLSTFFISKYEMTQGQWRRHTGKNPSVYRPPEAKRTECHPVESVSWSLFRRTLGELGLVLPTEAQWEYAARAGTTTRYWTGQEDSTLHGAANLADRFAQENGGPPTWRFDRNFDDGYVAHAPVTAFKPNRFGLHNVLGNVGEYCLDRFGIFGPPDGFDIQPGTGEILTPEFVDGAARRQRAYRGGAYSGIPTRLRIGRRSYRLPDKSDENVGVRPARLVE